MAPIRHDAPISPGCSRGIGASLPELTPSPGARSGRLPSASGGGGGGGACRNGGGGPISLSWPPRTSGPLGGGPIAPSSQPGPNGSWHRFHGRADNISSCIGWYGLGVGGVSDGGAILLPGSLKQPSIPVRRSTGGSPTAAGYVHVLTLLVDYSLELNTIVACVCVAKLTHEAQFVDWHVDYAKPQLVRQRTATEFSSKRCNGARCHLVPRTMAHEPTSWCGRCVSGTNLHVYTQQTATQGWM